MLMGLIRHQVYQRSKAYNQNGSEGQRLSYGTAWNFAIAETFCWGGSLVAEERLEQIPRNLMFSLKQLADSQCGGGEAAQAVSKASQR